MSKRLNKKNILDWPISAQDYGFNGKSSINKFLNYNLMAAVN